MGATRFETIDDLRQAFRDTDAEFVQMGPRVSGHTVVTSVGNVSLSQTRLEGGIRTRGTQLEQITLGMQVGLEGSVSQWDLDVLPGDLFVLAPKIERDGCARGAADFVMLSLYSGTLAQLGGPDVTATDIASTRRPQRFRPEPRLAAAVTARMRALAPRIAALQPSSEAQSRLMQQDLLLPFVLAMESGADAWAETRFASGASTVRRAEDWADGAEPEHLNMLDLSKAVGVSLRSLQRAFHLALGVGPAAYLRRRRLVRARAALALNGPEGVSVTEVAVAHGFWELGRFAVEYRKLFGERPSETLRNGARRRAAGVAMAS